MIWLRSWATCWKFRGECPAVPWRVESGQALRQPVRCRNVGGDDARYGLRHREIPRQRTGERHRSPFRPCDRPAIRCGDDRSDRNRHRTALRGAADRPQARGEDPRELGAAEGDQERDAVSPKLRRKHGLCRQDLPRVRLGEYRQGSGESLPPRRRHLGHRLQDCRRHRRQDGLWKNDARRCRSGILYTLGQLSDEDTSMPNGNNSCKRPARCSKPTRHPSAKRWSG